MDLVIVTPLSLSIRCGLSDHASVLANELKQMGVSVEIRHWPPFMCQRYRSVLLEFTPLSYSPIGLSVPLLLQLISWRLKGCFVLLFFHELPFTNGPSIKRAIAVFAQRLYCLIAAVLSNRIVVNQKSGLSWLRIGSPRSDPLFLPTFSNVGEAQIVPSPWERPFQVVVFGSPGKRRHAHSVVRGLGGYHQLFGSNIRVIDIGDPLPSSESPCDDVLYLGPLPHHLVFNHLLNSRFGFFYAESHQFSKSGVFAAYCSAGVVPVIASLDFSSSPFFLSPRDLSLSNSAINELVASIHANIREWFQSYGVRKSAETIYAAVMARAAR